MANDPFCVDFRTEKVGERPVGDRLRAGRKRLGQRGPHRSPGAEESPDVSEPHPLSCSLWRSTPNRPPTETARAKEGKRRNTSHGGTAFWVPMCGWCHFSYDTSFPNGAGAVSWNKLGCAGDQALGGFLLGGTLFITKGVGTIVRPGFGQRNITTPFTILCSGPNANEQ